MQDQTFESFYNLGLSIWVVNWLSSGSIFVIKILLKKLRINYI